jgi:hypothetical protein
MSLLISCLETMKTLGASLKIGTLVWKVLSCAPMFQGERVNFYDLPDEDFVFLSHMLHIAKKRVYYPASKQEMHRCNSLCNFGVLRQSAGGYRLTWVNRYLVMENLVIC